LESPLVCVLVIALWMRRFEATDGGL